MGHATFELVCALCQTLLQPTASAPWTATLWASEARAVIAQVSDAHEAPVTTAALLPLAPRPAPSLGTQRSFADGRALRVNLTPTPARCAPLVALTF